LVGDGREEGDGDAADGEGALKKKISRNALLKCTEETRGGVKPSS